VPPHIQITKEVEEKRPHPKGLNYSRMTQGGEKKKLSGGRRSCPEGEGIKHQGRIFYRSEVTKSRRSGQGNAMLGLRGGERNVSKGTGNAWKMGSLKKQVDARRLGKFKRTPA